MEDAEAEGQVVLGFASPGPFLEEGRAISNRGAAGSADDEGCPCSVTRGHLGEAEFSSSFDGMMAADVRELGIYEGEEVGVGFGDTHDDSL